MGRGRNKAKQQKVAREIKYMQREPDFDALSRELRNEPAVRRNEDNDQRTVLRREEQS
jgi:hypothetical protein